MLRKLPVSAPETPPFLHALLWSRQQHQAERKRRRQVGFPSGNSRRVQARAGQRREQASLLQNVRSIQAPLTFWRTLSGHHVSAGFSRSGSSLSFSQYERPLLLGEY